MMKQQCSYSRMASFRYVGSASTDEKFPKSQRNITVFSTNTESSFPDIIIYVHTLLHGCTPSPQHWTYVLLPNCVHFPKGSLLWSLTSIGKGSRGYYTSWSPKLFPWNQGGHSVKLYSSNLVLCGSISHKHFSPLKHSSSNVSDTKISWYNAVSCFLLQDSLEVVLCGSWV